MIVLLVKTPIGFDLSRVPLLFPRPEALLPLPPTTVDHQEE